MPDRATAYDRVPYPGHAYPQTHPNRLAAIGRRFGLDPAPVDRCALLEVGCGAAENLLPMAHGLPGSRFVGVDLAASAIARGREDASVLGLTNLTLEHLDFCDLPESAGTFDYIVAHGLYSWVPPDVREQLMALMRRSLAPQGIGFVSYHVYPGFYLKQMLREMLLYETGDLTDPEARVQRARRFATILSRTPRRGDDEPRGLLAGASRLLGARHPAAVLHDDLAPTNDAVYFHEFDRQATGHGLRYLAEAETPYIQNDVVPCELEEEFAKLDRTGDRVRCEQLVDFLVCRQFRQSLLCRAERDLHDTPSAITRLWIATTAAARNPVGVTPGVAACFETPLGKSLETSEPLVKAAFAALVERSPVRMTFDALVADALSRLADAGVPPPGDGPDLLAGTLWRAFAAGIVSLDAAPPPFVVEAGLRPEASAVARLQLSRQPEVTTLEHRTVRIEEAFVRDLITRLDGTRDRATLTAEWNPPTGAGAPEPGGRRAASSDARAVLLDACLRELGRLALLVA